MFGRPRISEKNIIRGGQPRTRNVRGLIVPSGTPLILIIFGPYSIRIKEKQFSAFMKLYSDKIGARK